MGGIASCITLLKWLWCKSHAAHWWHGSVVGGCTATVVLSMLCTLVQIKAMGKGAVIIVCHQSLFKSPILVR
jgi:hypothetical protein